MSWITLYGVVAVAVAIAAFLTAEWVREPGTAAPDTPGVLAVVTGVLWPVILLGVAQWGLIAVLHARIRHSRPQAGATDTERLLPVSR